jgi:hypothetical protein
MTTGEDGLSTREHDWPRDRPRLPSNTERYGLVGIHTSGPIEWPQSVEPSFGNGRRHRQ